MFYIIIFALIIVGSVFFAWLACAIDSFFEKIMERLK